MKKRNILMVICVFALVLQVSACNYYRKDNREPAYGNTYTEFTENPFEKCNEQNNTSAISLHAGTAAYTDISNHIKRGEPVPFSAVKIEEMVNYFRYDYSRPEEGEPLSINSAIIDTPWNQDTKLLLAGFAAEEIDRSQTKNNIVLLVDVSGSMFGADRLQLAVEGLSLMVDQLGEDDIVSLVTYAGGYKVLFDGISGMEQLYIKQALSELTPYGATGGGAAISKAYDIAFKHKTDENESSIIIITDGDFNVGASDTQSLKALISENSRKGVHLSAVGVGFGNMRSDMLETIADAGDGRHGYIASITDAKKFFVEELGGILNVVAKDAKAQITFNHERIKEFRLIGFENRQISLEEWDDTDKQAGTIGSGLQVTAMYEIKLHEEANGDFAEIKLRYKTTAEESKEISLAIGDEFAGSENAEATVIKHKDSAFIAAVIEFGLLLRYSNYSGSANYTSLLNRLETIEGIAEDIYRSDLVYLVERMKNRRY